MRQGDAKRTFILSLIRGHSVTIGTHINFASFVQQEGLSHAVIGDDVMEQIQSPGAKEWMESGSNPIKFVKGFRDLMCEGIMRVSSQTLAASQDADLIISSSTGLFSGHASAQVHGVPFVQAYLQPFQPTSEFPSVLLPLPFALPRALNYASHLIGGQLFWQAIRPLVNEARREVFKLPPLHPVLGPWDELASRKALVLHGYSPAVQSRPQDWPNSFHVTGYWFLDQPDWLPPPELSQFLSAGPPPVAVGFGSMSDRSPERMTKCVIEALEKTGQRGILLAGWGAFTQSDIPSNILLLHDAPHSWLLPQASVVVHHGGAGTTAAGFRSGRPSVIVPFMADQTFWAERAYALGVSPEPLPRRSLSSDALATRIMSAVLDTTLHRQSLALSERINQEFGLRNAVELIEQMTNAHPCLRQ